MKLTIRVTPRVSFFRELRERQTWNHIFVQNARLDVLVLRVVVSAVNECWNSAVTDSHWI